MKRGSNQKRFGLCREYAGYPVSLERWKVYEVLADSGAKAHGQVRAIDETGEDYLFPREYFAPIALRHSKEGYSASVPSLPGCWSQVKTARGAVGNLQAAAREYPSVAESLGCVPCGGWGIPRPLRGLAMTAKHSQRGTHRRAKKRSKLHNGTRCRAFDCPSWARPRKRAPASCGTETGGATKSAALQAAL